MKKINIKADFDVDVEIREEAMKAARYVVYEIPHIIQIMMILAILFTPWFIHVPVAIAAVVNFFYGNRQLFENKLKSTEVVEDVIHPADDENTKK